MQTKAYFRVPIAHGLCENKPFEKFNWTGRIKIKTVDGKQTLYLERWVMFLWVIPVWREWEPEDDFTFHEEETNYIDC